VGEPVSVTLIAEDVGTLTPLSADERDEANIVFGSVLEDHIDAGAGNDVLFGGLGADVFIFDTSYGFDIITDFSSGEDIIDLSRAGVTGQDDLTILDYENGNGALITYTDQGDQILLLGVDFASLITDDFVFV
jgi:Ca2+-binding RTX toxin-like protein